MSAAPLLSVVMPVYNGERHLGESLRSVLELGLPRLEVVVVDDGSTDGSALVAAAFGGAVRVVTQDHAGPAAARNRGIGVAHGEVVALIDADDRPTRALADVLLAALLADETLDIVQGRIQRFRSESDGIEPIGAPYDYVNLGSALYRRRVFETVGGFDETLSFSEDYDWMLRAFDRRVRKVRVGETALLYRAHEGSTTHGRSLHEIGLARVHRKAAERRRQDPGLTRVPDRFPTLADYVGRGPAAPFGLEQASGRSQGVATEPATPVDPRLPDLARGDDRPIDPSADAVLAFLVVRNEATRLPFCLDYHRRLGVSRFFVVDNGSVDGSLEWLLGQPDVHVWRAHGSFGAARCGTDWTEQLLRAHGQGHWCLVVDADELLVYPDAETRSLPEFCVSLDRGGQRAAMAIMIDLYPEGPIEQATLAPGQPFLDVCRYFDRRVFHDVVDRFADHDEHPSFFGGVRRRVFGGSEPGRDERFFYCLNKVPLLRYDPSMTLSDNLHWTTVRDVAVQAAALLHVKFVAGFAEQAAREAERGEHWSGAVQYARYAEVAGADERLTLFDPALSVRYDDSSQLVAMNILRPLADAAGAPVEKAAPALAVSTDRTPVLRQVRELIKARRTNERSAYGEAMAMLKDGRWLDAADAFQRLVAESPGFSWSHHYLGDALAALHALPDAVAAYQRAAALNPHFAPSHFNLGEVHARLEQWPEAVACYRRALALQPELPNAALGMARALRREARSLEQEAQDWYRRAHALAPSEMTIYTEALDLRPPSPDLYLTFADALSAQGHRTRAIFFYQASLQLRPEDAAACARLAKTLEQNGDLAGAIECCRRAIVFDEQRAEYRAQLAAMLVERGEIDEAIAAYRHGVALKANEPAWLKALGDLLARAGRVDEAAEVYAEAVSHGYQAY